MTRAVELRERLVGQLYGVRDFLAEHPNRDAEQDKALDNMFMPVASNLMAYVHETGSRLPAIDSSDIPGSVDALLAWMTAPATGALAGGVPFPANGSSPAGRHGWRLGASVVDAINRRGTGFAAALVSGGSVPVAVPLRREIVTDPRAARFVADIIPMPEGGGAPNGRFSYLRQTVRTNNAAPVAAAAKKPTSVYTVERIDDRTRTIAHLSEPVNRNDLADAGLLRQFLDDEMTYGLRLAVDAQILSGSGSGEAMTGILNTSGIGTQDFATDLLTTTRKAITVLELLDLGPDFYVFNPTDWETIELEAADIYAANPNQPAPVDRMARRLWGVGVVTSNSMPAGSALLGDFRGSSELYQTEGVRIDWSEAIYDPNKFGSGQGGTAFEANQLVFRAEGRWNIAVLRPDGFVSIDLTAAS